MALFFTWLQMNIPRGGPNFETQFKWNVPFQKLMIPSNWLHLVNFDSRTKLKIFVQSSWEKSLKTSNPSPVWVCPYNSKEGSTNFDHIHSVVYSYYNYWVGVKFWGQICNPVLTRYYFNLLKGRSLITKNVNKKLFRPPPSFVTNFLNRKISFVRTVRKSQTSFPSWNCNLKFEFSS